MKHKTLGQVFTPNWIVNEILDLIHYNTKDILTKYIIEPSCGNGAFLEEIVKRYINIAKENNYTTNQIKEGLEKYIYGVEIDKIEYNNCINRLNNLIEVKWNIFNTNTIYWYKDYLYKFDYVVGNPPYIRVHNIDIETRNVLKNDFLFAKGTMDLYVCFFELSIKLLKDNGTIGFITPNSYLHNTSYKVFREYLKKQSIINTIINFKSNKLFDKYSTYSAITILNKSEYFYYKEYINNKIELVNTIKTSETDWLLSNKSNEMFLNELKSMPNCVGDYFDVQYGIGTLRDKIYISKIKEYNDTLVLFNNHLIEKDIIKKIVKGSRFNTNEYAIFPYVKNNKYEIIKEDTLKEKYPYCYDYFLKHKTELESRSMEKNSLWYAYGRSQGIQTIHTNKIVINPLIKDKIDYYNVSEDVLVYSGLFIVNKTDLKIDDILKTDSFLKYIILTGKDFSGGYKSITPKQIKSFRF